MPDRAHRPSILLLGAIVAIAGAAIGPGLARSPSAPQVVKRPAADRGMIRADPARAPVAVAVANRPVAPCDPRPTVAGDMVAGQRTTIWFADDGSGSSSTPRPMVVDGRPVYYPPDPAAANRPKPIMPRLQKLSMTYHKVLVRTEPNTIYNGWFTAPTATMTVGTIIRDNGDGSAEVTLPAAPNALFEQAATLTVVTDRCTISAPIAIRPPTHPGRWFPPALILRCANRTRFDQTFGQNPVLTEASRLESMHPSRATVENVAHPDRVHHNCGPYGALHEGGIDQGAGGGSGTDIYLFWSGEPNDMTSRCGSVVLVYLGRAQRCYIDAAIERDPRFG